MIEKTEVYRVKVTGGAFDNLKAWDYEDFDPENVAEAQQKQGLCIGNIIKINEPIA